MSGCILLPSELKDKIEGIKNLTPQLQGVIYKEFLRRTNNEAALPLGNDDQIKEAIAKFNQFLQQGKQQSGVAQATPSSNKSVVLEKYSSNWTRQDAEQQPDKLFIFTDNTNRTSGKGYIEENSWYSKKYGKGLRFPTQTAAVIRGLPNARPISTQRWYDPVNNKVRETGRWQDSDFDEFKKVIDDEFEEIQREWNTGKYTSIVFPTGDGLFNTKISAITKQRTPKLYDYLQEKLKQLKDSSIQVTSSQSSTQVSNNKPTTTYDQILADTKEATKEATINGQRFNYKLENGQVTLYKIANGRLYQYETIKFPSNGWKGIEQSLPRLKQTELANEALEDENEDASNIETPNVTISEDTSSSYSNRTKLNAEQTDATIALAVNFNTTGEKATKEAAGKKYVKALYGGKSQLKTAETIVDNLKNQGLLQVDEEKSTEGHPVYKPISLNIAGNGLATLAHYYASQNKSSEEVQKAVDNEVLGILQAMQSLGVQISKIQSGGQTGVDEAGIKAAQKLGIEASIIAPKGFKFRDASGIDHSNEKKFKERFSAQSTTQSTQTSNSTQQEITAAPGTILYKMQQAMQKAKQGGQKVENITKLDSNIEVGDKQEKAKVLKEMTVVERIASVQLVSELFSEVTSELKNQLLQSTSAKVNYLKGLPQLSSYQEKELQQAEEVLNSMQSDDRAIFKVYPPILLFDSQNGGSKTDTFRGVKQRLEQYVNQEVEDIIAQDAQLGRTTTKEEALVRRAMYRKVLDNFDTFARDATPILELTEGIRVKGEDTTDEQAEADAEAKTYDHYMTDFTSVSSYDSMSQSVRRMLRQLNNLDADGNITYNMFGRPQRIRPEVAYIKIMNALEGMTRADQYIPRLERAAKKEAWISQVINNINNDEQLKTAVYVNFRKQNIHYWTIKNENGEVKTIKLNDDESIQSLLEEWRDSQIGGRQVNGVKAICTQNGQISKESFNRLTQIAESLTNLLKATNIHTESSWEEGERLIDHEGYLDTILEALQALGIDVNREQLIESISKEQEYDTELHPAARLLTDLTSMYNGMQTRYRSIAGTEIVPNMISDYNNNFTILAQILSDTKQTIFESSIRTNGKTKYSRVAPNYLSDEVSNLTNDDYYQEHLDKQYKRSSFLYSAENGGTWNNEILQLIEKSDSYRKKFNTRILDSINGKEYDKWTKTQVVKALMTMYLSQPSSTFENKELGIEAGWAYYTLPIYADTQTAEFMSGLRYSNKNNDIADTISNKMVRMILAEYERIQVVKYSKTKEGRVNAPIQNFDGKRGTQFTLIDGLNNVFVQQSTLDLLKSISERTTMDKLKEISGQNLKALQEKMPAGKLVSLEDIMTALFNSSATKEEINQEIAKYIKEELKGSDDARHSEYGKFLKDLQNQGIITINKGVISVKKEHQDLYMQILGSKLTANQFFEEFFFNNVYATANIIGLTTTDAAFYESAVDFQKRYKEIHAPGQRLYKDATWNGKKVSDGIERVVYLKDEEVLSNMIKTDSITKALDAQVKAGYLTKAEAEAIKGEYKKVNVTDGQGFRTLNSYRKVAIMSNQWSTVKENAFQRLLNKEWNKFDFDVLFNTFKPYMYTQVFVDRKRADGSTYTAKVPTQNKDSEALLMATMLNGGPMSQSNQLLALEEVMLLQDNPP